MKNKDMEFTFICKDKKIHAKCSKQKFDRLFYRVFIPSKKMKDEEVYIFYPNKDNNKLWWYMLPDKWQEGKAKAIAKTLEKIIFLPN
jgi:hypothetical protein